MSFFDLTGKVAILTGSSRGIGRAIAEAYAAAGAQVVISSRKQSDCEEVAAAINARHGRNAAIAIAANISDKVALKAMVDETRRQWGQIDILVCNAASNPHYGSLASVTDEQFRKIFDNNVLSTLWLITMVSSEMINIKDGAIVVISSVGGLFGSDKLGAYNMSKAADLQLVRNLAVEFGPYNIRINAIAPGVIRTDFAKPLWEDAASESEVRNAAPLGRIGEPHEIAGTAILLASKGGSYITGQTIVIDGGTSIRSAK